MLLTRFTKVAFVAVFTVAVGGGAALALSAATTTSPKATGRLNNVTSKVVGAGPVVDGVIVANGSTDGAGSSTSAGGTTSGSGTSAGASSGVTTGQGGGTGGATTGIVGPSTGTGGGGTGGGGTGGGGTGGGGTGGGGTGGSTGGGGATPAPVTGTGGSTGGSGDTLTPPTTPTIPTDVSLYREGSYTLTIPATPATSKKLCLSGEVDRCRTISVPALQAVSMTVSYAANASTTPPTFSVFPCAGGLGVTVAGITPGTNVTVRAQGLDVFGVIGTREVSQSASLCDA
ncbi:MAG: hypothetical protein QOE93_1365 [Actinomycetota bacterium]|nr:hypothetical protein [Actinomycetota bacterium]